MVNRRAVISLVIGLVTVVIFSGADWPRFRGPNGSGVAVDDQLPTAWSTTENVAWKVELPGRGISGPIVIGNRVILTCCSGYRQDRLHVICFETADGTKLWERQLWATGRTMTHGSICPAAPTPFSDGQRIFAYFSTNDLACFDLDGNLLWLRGLMLDYPNASSSLGLASSPLVVGETLVLQIESESQSLALGLDAGTGETKWKQDRPELANWTSPVLLENGDGGPAVVALQSSAMLTAHDPTTGEELWRYGQGCATQPSSVADGATIYVPSGGLTALRQHRFSAGPEVVWRNHRLGSSTSTPLLYRDRVFTIGGSILRCASAESGHLLWQLRLTGRFSSSPVAAGGRVYLFNQEGLGQVVDIEKERLIGGGNLGETILCSPAIAHNALYVRSDSTLWKIADTGAE